MVDATKLRKDVSSRLRRTARRLRGKPAPEIIRTVRRRGLTYLGENALYDLYDAVTRVETEGIQGRLIEAGCALGGSAIVIASAKAMQRPFYVYDVFGMIPEPSEHDDVDVHERYDVIKRGEARGRNGETYYGYIDNLYDRVHSEFVSLGLPPSKNAIHLVRGLFQDTLEIDEAVALAHIDGDWYESVWTCLERVTPKLEVGGVLIVDDYYCWSGCRKAVDQYFSDKKDLFEFVEKSRLHIRRKSR